MMSDKGQPDLKWYQKPMFGLILTVGVMSASTGAIFSRFAQGSGWSSIAIAFFRLLFATLILFPWILFRYREVIKGIRLKDYLAIGLTGLFLAIHFSAWITSLEYTSIASSVVLVTTTPIWVTLASRILFHEQISWKVTIGMLIALLGVVLVGISENCSLNNFQIVCANISGPVGTAALGDILAVIGAIMAASYLLMGKRIRKSLPLIPYTFLVYGISAIFLLIFLFLSSAKTQPIVIHSGWIWLLLLAIFPQTIGHGSLNYSIGHISPVIVSVALLGEPVGSTLMGILFFHEIPTPLKLIGAGIILAGLLFVTLSQRQAETVTFD